MKTDAWHCAGWSHELDTAPLARKLLTRQVVLFRDAHGAARALDARCPHRGADLGQGTIVDGCIECPFHGWRFAGDGHCVRVPSQPESVKISRQAHVACFPVCEQQGVLWIWMGADGAQRGQPPVTDVSVQGTARVFFNAHVVAASFLDVLENFFDKAHVPFIHTGSFGPDQDTLVARQRITVDADGRGLRAEDDPGCPWQAKPKLPGGVLGLLARLLLGLRDPVAQNTRFDVEAGAQIYLQYPNGTFDLFITRLTPIDDAHTWLFVESLRTRAPHTIGNWIQRRAISKVFAEGKRETTLILDPCPSGSPPPVSVEADRLGIAARNLYARWARGDEGKPA